jgi:xylulokinase
VPTTTGLTIGLDVGTQSTKGVVLDPNRPARDAIVARAGQSYGLIPGLESGAAEQHPHTWRDAVRAVLHDLLKQVDATKVIGIGVSGQQHGLVVLDESREVIRPAKLWCDTTTEAESRAISAEAGSSVPPGFTLPKLLWLKNHEPENFARVRHVLLPHDYINFLLTGQMFMEAGDASGTGALDPTTRNFNETLLRWVDERAPGFFPGLVAADSIGGVVSREAAAYFGLPEGVIVSPGGGDNMMSAIGSGATHEGATVISLGTSGTAFAYCSEPIIDPKGEIAAFCDSTGAYLPLLCTMNVTGVTEEVRAAFGLTHAEITERARQIPPGADGLLLLPYLVGERVPNLPNATGSLLGLRHGRLTPGHLFRAAIEGTSLGLASGILRMKELGLAPSSVSLVGGGSKNPLWRQILADMIGVSVTALLEPESAALGGALQALWIQRRSLGEDISADEIARPFILKETESSEPRPDHHATYQEMLLRFNEQTRLLYL